VAERTGQRATDLAGNAQRAAALFGNVDGFHFDRTASTARREAQEPFARAVVGDLLLHDFRASNGKRGLEFLAKLLGDIRHVVEV